MSLFSRIASAFRSQKLDQDLEDELRSHLEMRAEDNINSGMSAEEARLDARRRFGNAALIKESTRGQRIMLWLESLLQDARFGLRMLRRTPGFSLVAVLTVALTIGATAAVFTVINSVLLQPLPYKNSDRLIVIAAYMPRSNDEVTASAQYLAFKYNSRILEDAGAYSSQDYNVSGAGEPERIHGVVTTASFFTTLGIQAVMGRVFTADEDKPGAANVVVISHSFWQRHFNADSSVVGKSILLNNTPYTAIGVLPRSFRFPDSDLQPELIVPAAMPDFREHEDQPMLIVNVIGRMKAGISLEQAHADLETVYQQFLAGLHTRFGQFFEGSSVHTRLLKTELVGPVRRPLVILMTAVGCVLLIGCLNIANLQLARAVQRSQEVGVRSALGAGKLRLVRQLITENLVLSACGALGGALIAIVAAYLVRAAKLTALPHVAEVRIDFWVLGFIVIITLIAGLLFGLAPMLWVNRTDPAETIGKGNRSTADSGHRRLRNLLVVAELAVAVVLLAGAGLLVHSFSRLLAVDPGFDFHNVLTARVSFPLATLQPDPRLGFAMNVTRQLRELPSVESAAITTVLPFQPYDSSLSVIVEGKPVPPQGMSPFVPVTSVSTDYFHAMRIAFAGGRSFTDADTAASTPVAIVNQVFARKYFSGEDALGKRFRVPSPAGAAAAPWITIVGIVADIHHLGLAQNVSPEVYTPLAQFRIYDGVTFVARTSEIESTAAALRHIVAKLDPNQPVSDVLSMEQQLSSTLAARKFNMVALGAFALLALVLAAVGIFGVLSYSVAQRSHEIGVRMALGSDRERLIKLVLSEAAWLSVTGTICGIAGALALTRFMSSLLYHTSAFDPLTIACVSAVLIAVGLLAGYVPARRASRVDPLVALKTE